MNTENTENIGSNGQSTGHELPASDNPDNEDQPSNGEPSPHPAGAEDQQPDRTQAELLIDLASRDVLFHNPEGLSYVSYTLKGNTRTSIIESKDYKKRLRYAFYQRFDRPPSSQALTDAAEQLEAKAFFEGPEREVYIRVAAHEGCIYVDLCNERFEVVEIDEAGWEVIQDPPVPFRRVRATDALPTPERGGSLETLRKYVRVGESHFALLLGFLVQALRPEGPYPILALVGEQGTAKTTTTRFIRSLVDPATPLDRAQPRGIRNLAIAADNGWMLAYDNISGVAPWFSDALCRLATGAGFGTRKHYADREEEVFEASRPVVLNGIEDFTTRPDLADRAVILKLRPIPEEERMSEKEFWHAFDEDLPLLLGALFDAVSVALSRIDDVEVEELPRMADFALWAAAAEPAFPVPEGTFLWAYENNRNAALEMLLENDEVAMAIVNMLGEKGCWEGLTSELAKDLKKYLPNPSSGLPKDYPQSPQAMTAHLRRIAPVLRSFGIEREDDIRSDPRRRAFRLRLEK